MAHDSGVNNRDSATSYMTFSGGGPPNSLWTSKDVSKFLQVKESYLRDLRHQGRIPYIKVGRHVRYLPHEIMEWVKNGEAAETKSKQPYSIEAALRKVR